MSCTNPNCNARVSTVQNKLEGARKVPKTAEYRRCAHCMCQFAPITSNADDHYKFCSTTCEGTEDETEAYARSAYVNGY